MTFWEVLAQTKEIVKWAVVGGESGIKINFYFFFEDERSNTCLYAIGNTSIEGENLGKQKIAGRLLVNKPSTHVEECNLDKNTGSSVKAKLMGQCWWVEGMKRESDGDSFLMASVFSVTENEDSWLGVMKKEVWEVWRKEAGRVLKGAAEGIPPA